MESTAIQLHIDTCFDLLFDKIAEEFEIAPSIYELTDCSIGNIKRNLESLAITYCLVNNIPIERLKKHG